MKPKTFDDYVLLAVLVFGLIAPLVMLVGWHAFGIYFPPIVLVIFFSISVSSLTYRFLGGTEGASLTTGAIKLGGSAALFFIAIWQLNPILERQMDVDNSAAKYREAKVKLVEIERQLAAVNKQIVSVSDERDGARSDLAKLQKNMLIEAVDAIRNLDRDNEVSKELVIMSRNREGPWQPTSTPKPVTVSVADYLTGRSAAACRMLNFRGKKVELTSTLSVDDRHYRSSDLVIVERWSMISDQSCGDAKKFDIQIGCQLAEELFTSEVVRCVNGKQPAWQGSFKNLLPADAVIVFE